VREDNGAQQPSTATDKNKHMVTRIEIVQVQQEIVPAAMCLAQLVRHYQVLVQLQQFFTSFRFIWERQLRDLNQLALKHQTCHC
jgi:hypothetical protein